MKKLYLLLLLPLMIGMSACQSKLNADDVIDSVLEGERDRLPMILQKLPSVDNITIDSLRIMVDSEPMSGYLYTTWYDDKKSFSIIVEVTDIRNSVEHKGYIEWKSDWSAAASDYLQKKIYSYQYIIIEVKGEDKLDDEVVLAKKAYAEQLAFASKMKYVIIPGQKCLERVGIH